MPSFAALAAVNWRDELRRLPYIVAGAVVMAVSFTLFQNPHRMSAGGISGLSIITNYLTGIPVGTAYFVLNIPMMALGFFFLGGWRFLGRTLVCVGLFSLLTNLLVGVWPRLIQPWPLTDDLFLSAVFGGLLSGLGGGLVYREGGSSAGTGVLSRAIQLKTGMPLSILYVMTDGLIVLVMGALFGWAKSLYALVLLYLWGVATDYVLDNATGVQVATVVTSQPDEVILAIRQRLGHSASKWEITGGYSGERKQMIMCTVNRHKVRALKQAILAQDPQAFVVIGAAAPAGGGGFVEGR